MHQGRLLECGRPTTCTRGRRRVSCRRFSAPPTCCSVTGPRAACAFNASTAAAWPRAKSSQCCGRKKWNSRPDEGHALEFRRPRHDRGNLFAGAVERLRVRMASDGPVPVAPGREWRNELGLVARSSRDVAGAAHFPGRPGQRVAVGRAQYPRAADADLELHGGGGTEDAARALCDSPLLATSATACRRASRSASVRAIRAARHAGRGTGPGSADAAAWQLRHGAMQLSVRAPDGPARRTSDPHARSGLASLDAGRGGKPVAPRPAQACISASIPSCRSRRNARRHADLLDARSVALAEHGLDMRTELRAGDVAAELQQELLLHPQSMLVLGTSNPEALRGTGSPRCWKVTPLAPVLIVNASRARSRCRWKRLIMAGPGSPADDLARLRLTLGFSTFFLSALVLLPLAALVFKTASLTWPEFCAICSTERAVASYRLTFGAAFSPPASTPCSVSSSRGRWCATSFPAPSRRCLDRPALRAAHRRVGHRAGHRVRAHRMARAQARRAGVQVPTRGSASSSH
jgi:hypothetical protein